MRLPTETREWSENDVLRLAYKCDTDPAGPGLQVAEVTQMKLEPVVDLCTKVKFNDASRHRQRTMVRRPILSTMNLE